MWLYVCILVLAILHTPTCGSIVEHDTLLPIEILNDYALQATITISGTQAHIGARIDFTSAHIVIHPSLVHRSYGQITHFEYIHLGNALLYAPIVVANTAQQIAFMAETGAQCILGVGTGSVMWQRWQCATFTASHIIFKHGACTCQNAFRCDPNTTPLCVVSSMQMHAYKSFIGDVTLSFFGASDKYHYMSPAIYNQLHYHSTVNAAQTSSNLCFVTPANHAFCIVTLSHSIHKLVTSQTRGNTSIVRLSPLILFGHQFHFDSDAQTICTEYAPVQIDMPLLYEVLMALWILMLVIWDSNNISHLDVLCNDYSDMGNPQTIFVETVTHSTVFAFCVHFICRSTVWQLPLPGNHFILYAYIILLVGLSWISMGDFISGTVYGWRLCLVRPLLVEFQLVIALWLLQMHMLRGSWFTILGLCFFAYMCFRWMQQLILVFFIVTLRIDAHVSRTRACALLIALALGMVFHLSVLFFFILVDFFVAIGHTLCACTLVLSVVLLVITLISKQTYSDLKKIHVC